jgi:MFS family permease
MMVPVGRLIVLRNTEKPDLIRAIAFLTWPALTAPVVGPPLGGLITTYSSWPWIFLLNVPLGIIGLALALNLIPNSRGEAGSFDWRGFLITGFASFGLMYSLESIARNRIDWRITGPLLAASVAAGIYGIRHARRAAHPLLDLTPFALPTFAITVRGGLLIRTAISAAPFLLPLMFQLAFGLDPLVSGLLLLAVFAGNLGMKPATSGVLKAFGFRRTVLVNGTLVMATIMACGLMTPDTPKALIIAVLFVSGLSRSMQFTTINALSFSELSQERMSGANTLFSMMQQVGSALGVAIGAIALRVAGIAHPDSAAVTVGDFHVAFFAVGLVGLAGVIEFRRLPAHAGEVLRERPAPGKKS